MRRKRLASGPWVDDRQGNWPLAWCLACLPCLGCGTKQKPVWYSAPVSLNCTHNQSWNHATSNGGDEDQHPSRVRKTPADSVSHSHDSTRNHPSHDLR
ncbi:hypothetical protein AOQ84DRAFT_217933 [Glonium stellatum]|uniref:Uncharacterized protein n=1 Tax=Glonium stellatum TaxID=574774 RepID=A0A8E2EMY7_9PEZI|nr:hypothetical protein AOQ84DRAFT_217933 [Glonium stellatum]